MSDKKTGLATGKISTSNGQTTTTVTTADGKTTTTTQPVKKHNGIQQDFITALMLVITLILLSAMPVQASAPVLTRLADEVLDTNGQPVVNSVFYLDCGGETLTVTIEVTFTDGAVALLTGDSYCGAKIYVEGYVQLAEIVAMADGPDAVYMLFLPAVQR